jgi:NADH-quinone oxidoreductase subunit C
MSLPTVVTDLAKLKEHPAVGALVSWNSSSVQQARFDRDELTVWIDRALVREACAVLRENPACPMNFLADVTALDWYPAEPRFEVVYHLLSIANKERLRLKVKVDSSSPVVESVTSVWPGANFFEREVFDLFGIRFQGHPYLRRIMMPEDWEGHPLRKDYPVEGYR